MIMKNKPIIRSICFAVIAMFSATVLLPGCSNSKKETTTTATQTEYTTTTTSETELSTETEETEPTTSETLPMPTNAPVTLEAFSNITDEYTIDDIVNEVGMYAREEYSERYVWTLEDGSEVWVFMIHAMETVDKRMEQVLSQEGMTIVHVNGLEETVLYNSVESSAYGHVSTMGEFEFSYMVSREFGPELEAGYYILEENGYVYIIVSCGRNEKRGKTVYFREISLTTVDFSESGMMIKCEEQTHEEELPDLGRPSYPCCFLRMNKLHKKYVVVNQYRVEIPFMGYIKDSKTWEVIPPEDS